MECIVCAACVLLAVAKEQRGFGTYEMIAAPRLDGWSAAARETTVALTVITCPLLSRSVSRGWWLLRHSSNPPFLVDFISHSFIDSSPCAVKIRYPDHPL